MKVEFRTFRNAQFLLLIPESDGKEIGFDSLDKSGKLAGNEQIKLDAILTSNDTFKPYIRIRVK